MNARRLLLPALALGLLAAAVRPAAAQRVAVPAEAQVVSRPGDPWLGEDKVQHFVASAGATTLAFGAARIALDHESAVIAGIGVGAVAGLLKEVHDRRIGRIFSWRDLLYDAAGIALAYVWIREIE